MCVKELDLNVLVRKILSKNKCTNICRNRRSKWTSLMPYI